MAISLRMPKHSVASLVPDLITMVPEPRQIDGNQQVLAKWEQSDSPSLCGLYSLFTAIHHNSYDTSMTLPPRALGARVRDPWPGNIRELQNVVERSVIVCETDNFSVDESWLSRQPLSTEPKACCPGERDD